MKLQLIRNKALQLLSLRDYSEHELRQKLAQFCFKREKNEPTLGNHFVTVQNISIPAKQAIEETIQYCHNNGWLDDKEYAKKFIQYRTAKGYGEKKIIAELKMKGVTAEDIYQATSFSRIDASAQINSIFNKKFAHLDYSDKKNRMKVVRYFYNRGFTFPEMNILYNNIGRSNEQ